MDPKDSLPHSQEPATTLNIPIIIIIIIIITRLHDKQVKLLQTYFLNKQASSPLHATTVKADDRLSPLDIHHAHEKELATDEEYNNQVKRQLSQKALHGRHPNDLSQQLIDIEASNKWLTSADLFAETEGFLTVKQDQVVLKRNYMKYILEQPNFDELCRRCGKKPETIQHVTAACEQLAPTRYVKRHDGVANVIHQELAEASELMASKSPYYKYTPANVLKNDNFKLYWNRTIITDKIIHSNRPDITFMNKTTKNTFLTETAVPNTHNLAKIITGKQEKYRELANEISAMWKQNTAQVIPIVISTTGEIPKSLAQSLKRLNLHPNTYIQMKKSVILGTCSIVRNFLSYK
jgi:hypothetical protein